MYDNQYLGDMTNGEGGGCDGEEPIYYSICTNNDQGGKACMLQGLTSALKFVKGRAGYRDSVAMK